MLLPSLDEGHKRVLEYREGKENSVKQRALLGCRLALRPERLGNGLNDYGSNVAYVISDSGFQFRQNGFQFALSLGGNGPISE